MKGVFAILGLIACVVVCCQSEPQTRSTKEAINVKDLLKQQKDVLQILKYINSPIYDTDYLEVCKKFNIHESAKNYDPEAYKTFINYWDRNLFLPKGRPFSVLDLDHIEQVKALFKLMQTAKDYKTFFETAIWLRQNINERLFLYTFTVAVTHRKDTQGLIVPPIYEINPQYFFSSEVMQKAYQYKMSHFANSKSRSDEVYTIRSNHSGWYTNSPEQKLFYYLEDVGINSFYYYWNVFFPFWMEVKDFEDTSRRGEFFYFVQQQLLARYYLERLAHGGFDQLNPAEQFEAGYYPSLTYPNGLPFSEIPRFVNLQEYMQNYGKRWCFVSNYGYGLTYVSSYEQRITEAIDLGFFYNQNGEKMSLYTSDGFSILGNIIEGNAESPNPRYYGSYTRYLLGSDSQLSEKYRLAPTILDHYETVMRDPTYYEFCKKVVILCQKYNKNLRPYTVEDVNFPGVKIDKFEIGPLETYFDKFYADITNGLTVTPEEYQSDSTFRVRVEQYRMNHRKFTNKIYVTSEKTEKVIFKVFIGPKTDERGRSIEFNQNRVNFKEIDEFAHILQPGKNVIVRKSRDMVYYIKDFTSYLDLHKNVKNYDEESNYSLNYDKDSEYPDENILFGFPQRHTIPIGREEGFTYQMYVIAYPYVPIVDQKEQSDGSDDPTEMSSEKIGQYWQIQNEKHPMGFPFDRPPVSDDVYYVSNAHLKDVTIYHKKLRPEELVGEEPNDSYRI